MVTFYPTLLKNLTLLFTTLLLIPFSESLSFQKSRFDANEPDIAYQGDAIPSVGAIDLINEFNYVCRVGWATYAEKVPLYDPNTGKVADFTTHFSFTITTQTSLYGSGLTFFLAPVGSQIPPNSAGGFLGLFNTTTSDSSRNQIVMIEFDSFADGWDPSYEHVGINNNSIASAVTTPWNASAHSGDNTDVWISYNSSTKNLSVHWSYEMTAKENVTSLSYPIDLAQVLPQWVTIGFTGATGANRERTILNSWEFSSSLEIKGTSGNNPKKISLIVGLTVSGGVLIAAFVATFLGLTKLKRKRREKEKSTNLASINNDDLERGAGPRRFSYNDLASATNNFLGERKLGEGGFGAVYRGYLPDLDTLVAVKKISRGSRQGKKEYLTEVKIISQLRHRNLVQLLGWCHDKGEFLLVYEFMPNGSLNSHLFNKRISPLTWSTRYKISLGLASALLYLHEEWERCVVHRDIKSSNIMLDSSFNVKLGDFGLARLMDHELGPQTTGLVGTLGYLAPEYISTGRASKESDVYSFGVVALEIATGRKAVDPMEKDSEIGLVQWVWDLYGKGNLVMAVDERMKLDFDQKQVECLMIVGLWCAHPDRSLRPSIKQAIQVLNFEATWPNLPASMPVPVYHVPLPSVSSSEPFISTSLDAGR
ncbi:hypothetical protein TIFTF001_004562 [Ficus carica]|uniref:Protein kinase domain-containing protein n=1 Tax=Ficus carica TaxID=3494 RepID=A0AA87ZDE2_FICCA|nr:hypothetical protein TIFTF001_004562 [Ficus carica]